METKVFSEALDAFRAGEIKTLQNWIGDATVDYDGFIVSDWKRKGKPNTQKLMLLSDSDLETYIKKYVDVDPSETYGEAVVTAELSRLEHELFTTFELSNYKPRILLEAIILFPSYVEYVYKSLFNELKSFKDMIVIALSVAKYYNEPKYLSTTGVKKIKLIGELESPISIYISKKSTLQPNTMLNQIVKRKEETFEEKLHQHLRQGLDNVFSREITRLFTLILGYRSHWFDIKNINTLDSDGVDIVIEDFESYFLPKSK